MPTLGELPDEPLYPIKAVCSRTGIQPVTLRAWERRYNLLTPSRAENHYRLYSEQDIAILTWVKARVEDGLQISAVARLVEQMRKSGDWPEARIPVQTKSLHKTDQPAELFVHPLFDSLYEKKEQDALYILNDLHTKYELIELFTGILTPVLVKIGEAWYEGRIGISTEHFASSLIRGWLLQLYYAMPSRSTGKRILVGNGPDEDHEIGELMFACLLREKGFFIDYVGPNNPVEDLVDYASEQNAAMVILTASLEINALELKKTQEKLNRLSKPPIFAYAGQAFVLFPNLRQTIPGVFLGSTLSEGLEKVGELLAAGKKV